MSLARVQGSINPPSALLTLNRRYHPQHLWSCSESNDENNISTWSKSIFVIYLQSFFSWWSQLLQTPSSTAQLDNQSSRAHEAESVMTLTYKDRLSLAFWLATSAHMITPWRSRSGSLSGELPLSNMFLSNLNVNIFMTAVQTHVTYVYHSNKVLRNWRAENHNES